MVETLLTPGQEPSVASSDEERERSDDDPPCGGSPISPEGPQPPSPPQSSNCLTSNAKSRLPGGQLTYYGYRYFDPVTGRWPSRDPIGERGGMNLYQFACNNSIDLVDRLGMSVVGEVTSSGCYKITLKMKAFIVSPPTKGEIAAQFKKDHSGTLDDPSLSEAAQKHEANTLKNYDRLGDLLYKNIVELERQLTKKLNDVYGGKDCCCIEFVVDLSQGHDRKHLQENEDFLEMDWREEGRKGRGHMLGHGVFGGLGLLDDKTFPHEVGHKLGLRHPHPLDMTEAEKKEYGGGGLVADPQLNAVYRQFGFDENNALRGIDSAKNVMGYGDGVEVTCEQLKAIKSNVENWNKK